MYEASVLSAVGIIFKYELDLDYNLHQRFLNTNFTSIQSKSRQCTKATFPIYSKPNRLSANILKEPAVFKAFNKLISYINSDLYYNSHLNSCT